LYSFIIKKDRFAFKQRADRNARQGKSVEVCWKTLSGGT